MLASFYKENLLAALHRRARLITLAFWLAWNAPIAQAQVFFDWDHETFYNPANPNPLPDPLYIPAPTLEDWNITQVTQFLQARQAAGLPLAVKIRAPLGPASVALLSQLPVKYVFADFENAQPGATPAWVLSQTQTLVGQLNASSQSKLSQGTLVSNYEYSVITPGDPTRPTGQVSPDYNAYRASGVNLVTESLYPGDSSFRTPAAGTGQVNSSTAPNIRSALFTLPITRFSLVQQNMNATTLHIPYISRFDNYQNSTLYTKTNAGIDMYNGQPAFVPGHQLANGQPMSGATDTTNQMLSRTDFEAMVLHYRMRGANGFQLNDENVAGYTQLQLETDALAGWNNSVIANVMSGPNGRGASLATYVNVDGTLKSIESAGVVWSAVTNDGGGIALALLVSNLDNVLHTINLNTRINGATLNTSIDVAAGEHSILRFTRGGTIWNKVDQFDPFAGNSADMNARDGVGIPEPTAITLLTFASCGVLLRRRRRPA